MNLGARCRIEISESKRVLDRMNAAARKVLMQQGAYIRKVAQNSMTPKDRPSAPGHAPRSITGLLRDFLLFSWDSSSSSVVVGPAALKGGVAVVPRILEEGGTELATVKRGREWKKQQVTIAPRPYMAPALERSQAQLPQLWAKSVV